MNGWEEWLMHHPKCLLAFLAIGAAFWVAEKVEFLRWMFGRPRSDMERQREREKKKD